jgi:glycosyltransferase involved in cell wall biosynthesis
MMNRSHPLRIAMLYAHPFSRGGVETHVLSVLRLGDVERFVWTVVGEVSSDFGAEASKAGAAIVPWSAAHALDAIAAARLVRLLRRHPVDALHVHSLRANVLGRAAAARLGLPVAVTIHLPSADPVGGGGLLHRLRHAVYGRVEARLNRLPGYVIHVSTAAYERALADGAAPAGRTAVIENGVDFSRFESTGDRIAMRRAVGSSIEATVATCVARLDSQKGLNVLLDAVARLRKLESALEIWMVGDGPLRGALEARCRRLALQGKVRWLGWRRDVPELLKASDLFVLPSHFETTSIALLEALAAGLPIVATDVGDNRRLLKDGRAGRLVPSGDAVALAASLHDLIECAPERERLSAAARLEAREHGAARMVERLQDVYAALVDPSGDASRSPQRLVR